MKKNLQERWSFPKAIKTEWMGDISWVCGGQRLSRLGSEVSSHPATYSSGLAGPKPAPVRISDYWLYWKMGRGKGMGGWMNECEERRTRRTDIVTKILPQLTRRKITIRKDQKKNYWKQSLTLQSVYLKYLRQFSQLSIDDEMFQFLLLIIYSRKLDSGCWFPLLINDVFHYTQYYPASNHPLCFCTFIRLISISRDLAHSIIIFSLVHLTLNTY